MRDTASVLFSCMSLFGVLNQPLYLLSEVCSASSTAGYRLEVLKLLHVSCSCLHPPEHSSLCIN